MSEIDATNKKDIKKNKFNLDSSGFQLTNDQTRMFIEKNEKVLLNSHFDKNASESFNCFCSLCENKIRQSSQQHQRRVFYQPFNERAETADKKNQEKDLNFILKRLAPHPRATRTLSINFPDTLSLVQGEPKQYMYVVQDHNFELQIKVVKQKERLSFPLIRKQILKRISERQKQLFPFDNKNNHNHQQKSKKVNKQQNENIFSERSSKEIALIKFTDDNCQVQSDLEFLNQMSKHKNDISWQEIQYIQEYIKFQVQLTVIKHNYIENQIIQKLYERAKLNIQIINQQISPVSYDYISNQDEKVFLNQLKQVSSHEYTLYLTYQIIHYIEVFYNTKINSGIFHWHTDNKNICFLMDVTNVTYQEVQNYYLTDDSFYKQLNEKEEQKLDRQLSRLSKQSNQSQGINEIEDFFNTSYLNQKREAGFIDKQYNSNIYIMEDLFGLLHPELKNKYKQIFSEKPNKNFGKFKKQVIWTRTRLGSRQNSQFIQSNSSYRDKKKLVFNKESFSFALNKDL